MVQKERILKMERDRYLKLCQKCSVLKKRIGGVIDNIPKELIVSYSGNRYYPEKYELSFDCGHPLHTAVLHGLYTNSLIYANLEKVGEAE